MHYVIMGCGRVGARLAQELQAMGNTVAIVDRDENAFRRLPPEFLGRRVVGVGFDRETLIAAGIEEANAFAAVSSGDNSNILAARVARETFGVPHVVARIYDPGRAEVYERLGIPTVATVRWTTDQVKRRLIPDRVVSLYENTSGTIALIEVRLDKRWVGERYTDIEEVSGARLAYVARLNQGLLPTRDLVHQEGDIVTWIVETSQAKEVEKRLTTPAQPQLPAGQQPKKGEEN